MTLPDANEIVTAAQGSIGFAFNAATVLSPILQGTGGSAITTAFTGLNTGLSNQLKAVAKIIEQHAAIGHQREIFFVSIGGFDTHTGEVAGHNSLFPQVSKAVNAFYQATVGLGVASNVTTFTLSDFGRTMKPNGGGTDHGWGSHQFVVGGGVLGNKFYGTYPNVTVGRPGRLGQPGALDSDDLDRPGWRDARQMVRRERRRRRDDLPQPRELHREGPRIRCLIRSA